MVASGVSPTGGASLGMGTPCLPLPLLLTRVARPTLSWGPWEPGSGCGVTRAASPCCLRGDRCSGDDVPWLEAGRGRGRLPGQTQGRRVLERKAKAAESLCIRPFQHQGPHSLWGRRQHRDGATAPRASGTSLPNHFARLSRVPGWRSCGSRCASCTIRWRSRCVGALSPGAVGDGRVVCADLGSLWAVRAQGRDSLEPCGRWLSGPQSHNTWSEGSPVCSSFPCTALPRRRDGTPRSTPATCGASWPSE